MKKRVVCGPSGAEKELGGCRAPAEKIIPPKQSSGRRRSTLQSTGSAISSTPSCFRPSISPSNLWFTGGGGATAGLSFEKRNFRQMLPLCERRDWHQMHCQLTGVSLSFP